MDQEALKLFYSSSYVDVNGLTRQEHQQLLDPSFVVNTTTPAPAATMNSDGGKTMIQAPRASKSGQARKPLTEAERLILGPTRQKTKQKVLRQQQQRLLLLHHASKCKYGTAENFSTCPATIHCSDMKQLWQHITRCKNQGCDHAHCVSSRYVLSHYNRCQDESCAVCLPLRNKLRRMPRAGSGNHSYTRVQSTEKVVGSWMPRAESGRPYTRVQSTTK